MAVPYVVISYQYWTTTAAELSHLRPDGMSALAIWMYRIGNLALNSLNAFWFYKMLSGALKVLGGEAHCPVIEATLTNELAARNRLS